MAKVVKFYDMISLCNRGLSVANAYHWLNMLEHASVVKQSYGVSGDEPSERVSSDAELLDSVAVLLQLLESGFDLVGNTLASKLNTVVGEAAGIALWYKNVKVWVSLFDASGEVIKVLWLPPETGCC